MPDERAQLEALRAYKAAKDAGDERAQLEALRTYHGQGQAPQAPDSPLIPLLSIPQGVLFGGADEAIAAVGALPSLAGGPAAYAGDYAKRQADIDAQYRRYAARAPVGEFAGNVAGGLLTGGLLSKALPVAKTAAGRVAQSIGFGSGAGGVAGALYSSPGERPQGALTGAVTGGAIGAALPFAIGVGKGLSAAGRAIGGGWFSAPRSRASRQLLEALDADKLSVQDAQRRLADLGPGGMIADVGEGNVLGLSRAVQATPGAGKYLGLESLTRRQEGQLGRMDDVLMRAITPGRAGQPINWFRLKRQLAETAKVAAAPAYEAAYASPIEVTPRIMEILKSPELRGAIRSGERLARLEALSEGRPAIKAVKGQIFGGREIGVQEIDYVKRGIDAQLDKMLRTEGLSKTSDVGRQLTRIKKELVEAVDGQLRGPKGEPGPYEQARALWGGLSEANRAMRQGRKVFSMQPEEVGEYIAGGSASDRAFFRAGGMQALREKLSAASDMSDKTMAVFKRPVNRARLKAMIGDDAMFDEVERRMLAEGRQRRTYDVTIGGSPTARIEAEKAALASDAIGGLQPLLSALRGEFSTAAGQAGHHLFRNAGRIPPQVLEELAPMLYQQGPAAARALQQLGAGGPPLLSEEARRRLMFSLLGAGASTGARLLAP